MFKRLILFLLAFFCSAVQPAFSLDWKQLHERSDLLTLDQARSASRDDPADIAALYVLGLVDLNLHRDDEADEVFTKLTSLAPETVELRWGKAEVLRRQHQFAQSEKILGEVINARPDFVSSYISLAYIRFVQRKFNDVVSLAEKVIARPAVADKSNVVRAYLFLGAGKGMIAYFGGPLSKVINGTFIFSNLREAQKRQPDSIGVYFGMGNFYLLAPTFTGGNLKLAENYLLKAAALDPLFPDTFVRLAQLYRIKGDGEKYSYYLNRALQVDPKNELALDTQSGTCRFICMYDGK